MSEKLTREEVLRLYAEAGARLDEAHREHTAKIEAERVIIMDIRRRCSHPNESLQRNHWGSEWCGDCGEVFLYNGKPSTEPTRSL